jgi:hypothetical protein
MRRYLLDVSQPGRQGSGAAMAEDELWRRRDEALKDEDLVDFDVGATDGMVGEVASIGYNRDAVYLMVRPVGDPELIVAVPTSQIDDVCPDAQDIKLKCTKDQVLHAPSHREPTGTDPDLWNEIVGYWGDHSAVANLDVEREDPPLRF